MSSPSSRRSPSPKPRPNRLAHTFEEKHETIEHPPRGCVAAAVYRRSLRPDINHRHRHGDNYQTFGPYPAPPPVSTINDNYWINIATYPPVATPAPAWVTTPHSLWAPPRRREVCGSAHAIRTQATRRSRPPTPATRSSASASVWRPTSANLAFRSTCGPTISCRSGSIPSPTSSSRRKPATCLRLLHSSPSNPIIPLNSGREETAFMFWWKTS